jgi:hypothetical protein
MPRSKVRVETSLIMLLAVLCVALFAIFPTWRVKIFLPLSQRHIERPTSEEYAVYSAFIEDFLRSQKVLQTQNKEISKGIVYVTGKTMRMQNPGSILPLEVAVFDAEEMGRDFYRQNSNSWPLEPRFQGVVKVVLVGTPLAKGLRSEQALDSKPRLCDFGDAIETYGNFDLSRVGFNRNQDMALLSFTYKCGALVGARGGLVGLEKSFGSWRVKKYGSGWIS